MPPRARSTYLGRTLGVDGNLLQHRDRNRKTSIPNLHANGRAPSSGLTVKPKCSRMSPQFASVTLLDDMQVICAGLMCCLNVVHEDESDIMG